MKYETLKFEIKDTIATLTINRPEKFNALNETVLKELKSLLGNLRTKSDAEVRGMIFTGSGDKAFIAGADIKAMSLMTPDEGEGFARLGQEVSVLFEALPFPVIACVNGFALGGGCEMAMSCDYIYATQSAVFGQPEVNLGLIPGFGGCVRLTRYVGVARAKELIYTGRNVMAKEAQELGLVANLFSNSSEMLEAAKLSLVEISKKSSVAVAICKSVINKVYDEKTLNALDVEKSGFRRAFESEDKIEGMKAFLEKRPPNFIGK